MQKNAAIFLTGALVLLVLSCVQNTGIESQSKPEVLLCSYYSCVQGGVIRSDTTQKKIALVFTADTFGEGGPQVLEVLQRQEVKGSFFFTGNFYRDTQFEGLIKDLKTTGHYLGAHSDRHLLYCDWTRRDSLLVTRQQFLQDLDDNYREMARFGIRKPEAPLFLPPYEWYNDSISHWTAEYGLQLINYTPGTRSHADYTTPEMPNYLDSETIFQSIVDYETSSTNGLNGFLLLSHIGTDPARTDKFYGRLEELVEWLKGQGYRMVRIEALF